MRPKVQEIRQQNKVCGSDYSSLTHSIVGGAKFGYSSAEQMLEQNAVIATSASMSM